MMDLLEDEKFFKLRKRKGSILAFILIILVIVSLLGTSILSLFSTNLKQAKQQQDSLQAYYLAYTGVELAYAALLDDATKLKQITNDKKELVENIVDFGDGKINVKSKLTTMANFDGWVEITSTGTLNKNNLLYKRTMLFDPANPVDTYWKD